MRKLSAWMVIPALSRKLFLPLLAIAAFSPTWLAAQTAVPTPKHIVIVIEENRSFEQIEDFIKSHENSYLARLKKEGAYFTSFFARLHPSQPNYIELFSGGLHGITDNEVHHTTAPSIAGELIKQKKTFIGYADGLPESGFDGKTSGSYARKHCPWISFCDVPKTSSLPFTDFPTDAKGFENLPTLSFVIPNLKHDMHGTTWQFPFWILAKLFKKDSLVKDGDVWLEKNLKAYAEWAKTNDSLLIVTWDEDDSKKCDNKKKEEKGPCETLPPNNQIATIFVGQMVKRGPVPTRYTHLDLLRTLEDMYGVPPLGASKDAKPILDCWQ